MRRARHDKYILQCLSLPSGGRAEVPLEKPRKKLGYYDGYYRSKIPRYVAENVAVVLRKRIRKLGYADKLRVWCGHIRVVIIRV
jgi:hypothetical protein